MAAGSHRRPVAESLEGRWLLAKVAVIGDFTSGTALRDVSNLMKSWNPAAVVTLGDNYYNDANIDTTAGQYFHDYISPYTGSYGAGSSSGNKFWPTLGNHDYDNGLSKYTSFFQLPNNERYYATPVQDNVQFFIMNSNEQEPDGTSATSTQALWLKSALAASTATWKIVTFHHPVYTSGAQGDNAYLQWPFALWGATAVMSGHDHDYERLNRNNFPYFVNGLGGAEIRPRDHNEPGSQAFYNSDYGAMLIDAGDSSINFKFFSRDGVIHDDYTINKSTAPSTNTALIRTGATWKYLDNGTDAGTSWRDVSFDDSAWKSGQAELGYGDGDESTVVSYGASSSSKYVTTYFRKTINIADASAVSALSLKLLRDDGAAVYVNGSEAFRSNMPTGTIGYRTFASTPVENEPFIVQDLDPSLLRTGDNVIAVEVHQSDAGSSDVSFDLALDAFVNGSGGGTTQTAPAAPSNLTASADSSSSIALAWTDNASSESGFRIERSTDGVNFVEIGTVAAAVTTYRDQNLASSTTYTYRVRAYNAAGTSAYTGNAAATTAAATTTTALPTPWATADIGTVGLAGSASYSNGVYTVKGAGSDIWGKADSFRFVYAPLSGDGTIVARVTGLTNTRDWAKAGLMIRESLAANAREAAVHVTPTDGTVMTYRATAGASSNGYYSSGATSIWLKLTRTGNTFTSYRSTNGTTWTTIGTTTIAMNPAAYIGLCVTSKDTTKLNTATFTDVTLGATAAAASFASAPSTTPTPKKRTSAIAAIA